MYLINREFTNLTIIYLIGLLYWLSCVIFMEFTGKDICMLRKFIIPNCNGWCMSHFMHYIVLAYVAPSYWWLLIIAGFLFEFIELCLSNASNFIDYNIIKDTVTNTLGVIIGLLLYKIFKSEVDLKKSFNNLFNKIKSYFKDLINKIKNK